MKYSAVERAMELAETRAQALTNLGDAHAQLVAAIESYRSAWKATTGTGWAKTELVRSGFTDPARLPRPRFDHGDKPAQD